MLRECNWNDVTSIRIFENILLGENDMEVFAEYLAQIDNPQHRKEWKRF